MATHCRQCMSPDLEYLADGTARCRVCGALTPSAWCARPTEPAGPAPAPAAAVVSPVQGSPPPSPASPAPGPPPAYAPYPPPAYAPNPPAGYGPYPAPGYEYGWYPTPGLPPAPYRTADFSTIFGDTFRLFLRHPLEFFLPFFVLTILITSLTFLAFLFTIGSGGFFIDPTTPVVVPLDRVVSLGVLVLVIGLASFVVVQVVQGAVAHFAVLRHRNAAASLGGSLRHGLKRFLSLVGAAILLALLFLALFGGPILLLLLGVVTLNFALLGIGGLTFLIALPIGIFLWIALSLFLPAIMMENVGAVEGLRRSWALTKGHRLSLFGVYLVLGLLAFVVSLSVTVPASLLGDPIVNLVAQSLAEGLVGSWVVIAGAVAYDLIVNQPAYPMWYGPWAPPPAAPAVPPSGAPAATPSAPPTVGPPSP